METNATDRFPDVGDEIKVAATYSEEYGPELTTSQPQRAVKSAAVCAIFAKLFSCMMMASSAENVAIPFSTPVVGCVQATNNSIARCRFDLRVSHALR